MRKMELERFVKGFTGKTQTELAKAINEYSKENNLTILQISYVAGNSMHISDKAFVLFEKN